MTMNSKDISRRYFLKQAVAASAATAIPAFWTPAKANPVTTSPFVSANDKVNLALIGIGQRGGEIANEFINTGLCNIVALCDVDMGAPHTQEIISKCPGVSQFQDFRKMFEKMGNRIDAVTVGVPDFSHFPIAMEANDSRQTCIRRKTPRTHFPGNRTADGGRKKYGVVTQNRKGEPICGIDGQPIVHGELEIAVWCDATGHIIANETQILRSTLNRLEKRGDIRKLERTIIPFVAPVETPTAQTTPSLTDGPL